MLPERLTLVTIALPDQTPAGEVAAALETADVESDALFAAAANLEDAARRLRRVGQIVGRKAGVVARGAVAVAVPADVAARLTKDNLAARGG